MREFGPRTGDDRDSRPRPSPHRQTAKMITSSISMRRAPWSAAFAVSMHLTCLAVQSWQMRNIFIVVAGGNYEAEKHFEDTIKKRRTVDELEKFLPSEQVDNIKGLYHNSSFIVWGAIPGPQNERTWDSMQPGDLVLITNHGRIRYFGEVGAKARSKELAKYFWQENPQGNTWELIYFIVNDQAIDVPIAKLNPLIGYKDNFSPQGFLRILPEKVEAFYKHYGDLLGVLKTFEKGEEVHQAPEMRQQIIEKADEEIERAPTEHDEMQWRLIRLGQLAKCDVWVPANDQSKQYEGNIFREHVLKEFHQSLDVPLSIKNIDVVWKFGPYSIKSAFEIENSTSVYSGILRLSDLRTETPNSSFPLVIVASEERRRKVFDELRRPTFSGPCLRLNEVVRFMGYKVIREFDNNVSSNSSVEAEDLIKLSELVPV